MSVQGVLLGRKRQESRGYSRGTCAILPLLGDQSEEHNVGGQGGGAVSQTEGLISRGELWCVCVTCVMAGVR